MNFMEIKCDSNTGTKEISQSNFKSNNSESPLISIGLPLYNAEKFLKKRLNNIFSQTYDHFELILSVDPSDDSTIEICKEFVKKDIRIKYFEQNKKMGWVWSFSFVAKKATGKYFVWAAADDLWSTDFLEKHIKNLENDPKSVGCYSKITLTGKFASEFQIHPNDSKISRIYKQFRKHFRAFNIIPIQANSFKNRATIMFRNTSYPFYGVYRRQEFQKSIIEKEFFVWDFGVFLNVIRYGNINLIDEYLYVSFWDDSTTTRKGIINQFHVQNTNLNEYFFPYSSFSYWCARNIGFDFFIKNFDFFLWLNFMGEVAIVIDLYRHAKKYFKNVFYKY